MNVPDRIQTEATATDPQRPDADRKPRRDKSRTYFWRAAWSIWPYRRFVLVSIVCALFVGIAISGGITTMLPILRVLLNRQTVRQWVDSQLVERRLGVTLADAGQEEVRVFKVHHNSPASEAGLRIGDRLAVVGAESVRDTLAALADPARASAVVSVDRSPGESVTLRLPEQSRYLLAGRRVAGKVSDHPVVAIGQIFGVLLGLAVVCNVIRFFQEYYSDKAATLAVNDIRRRLYDHILHVPMSHLARRGTSDMTSRLVQDATNLEMGFKTVLGQSIQEPIKAVMALGLALIVSWKLTLVIIIFAPLMTTIIRKFGKKMRRASRAALQKSSTMLGQIESTFAGIRVVKGASAERIERRRYRGIMNQLVVEQLKMSRIDAVSAPALETLTLIVVGGVVLLASYMVLVSGTLSPTSFFLIMTCLATIGDSLRRVNKVNSTLQRSNAAAQRIFEIFALPVERQRRAALPAPAESLTPPAGVRTAPAPRIKLPPLRREIRFEHVTFAYPGSPSPAVIDVNLTVPKGKCVAVVGRNGSGKTTLLALLPRFYDPQQGRVLIDDVDVRDATLRSLRGQISIVTQESVIFPGTVAQNIAYGNPRATREQIIDAAKRAFAHEFILQKPRDYDTMLGELGGSLSGGQKQRLCIARAILRHAPILVLDEATSQVDAESEHLIQQAIDSLMHDAAGTAGAPTTFVIAHRFSTILGADTIVVMDQGQIIGQGRHDELLESCETYRQLYDRQLFKAPAEEEADAADPLPATVSPDGAVVAAGAGLA